MEEQYIIIFVQGYFYTVLKCAYVQLVELIIARRYANAIRENHRKLALALHTQTHTLIILWYTISCIHINTHTGVPIHTHAVSRYTHTYTGTYYALCE